MRSVRNTWARLPVRSRWRLREASTTAAPLRGGGNDRSPRLGSSSSCSARSRRTTRSAILMRLISWGKSRLDPLRPGAGATKAAGSEARRCHSHPGSFIRGRPRRRRRLEDRLRTSTLGTRARPRLRISRKHGSCSSWAQLSQAVAVASKVVAKAWRQAVSHCETRAGLTPHSSANSDLRMADKGNPI